MRCKHCKQFFKTLHRRCTVQLYGECDCPICQGVCSCPARLDVERFSIPFQVSLALPDLKESGLLISSGSWGSVDVQPDLPPLRTFGSKR